MLNKNVSKLNFIMHSHLAYASVYIQDSAINLTKRVLGVMVRSRSKGLIFWLVQAVTPKSKHQQRW